MRIQEKSILVAAAVPVAAAVANFLEKDKDMNIFKKKPEQEKDTKITQASADDKTTAAEQPKQNPHETGGCCGSCGRQKGQGL